MKRQWLKKLRVQADKTHVQVAEESGIERSYYTKIENGSALSVTVSQNIASVLKFDWTLFFKQNGDDTAQSEQEVHSNG